VNPDELLKALAAALAGEGSAVSLSPDRMELIDAESAGAPEGTAVVVGTSGSTGRPKRTMLGVDALAASSMGTAVALRGEGQWLLALPTFYVAGVQVLVRSLFAGTRPEVMRGPFSPEAFTAAAQEMTDPFRLTSLVPTQLQRLIDAQESLSALRRFNAILLGGAPAGEQLLHRALDLGLNVVTTYGSAETCGGCVYDGEPLDGVEVAVDDGRILLGGEVLAAGYLGDPQRSAATFRELNGKRWYRTEDLGEFDEAGRLRVIGRADDVLITGGLKVSAATLAGQLQQLSGVRDAFVTGVADPEWGQRVVAAVLLDPGSELGEPRLRAAAKELLAPHEVPKRFLVLPEFPYLPQGKIDRRALIERLRAADSDDLGENGQR